MHTTDDGADQTAFGLPHFSQVDKATAEGLKYKVKRTSLTVLLMHLLDNYVSHSAVLTRQSCMVQSRMVLPQMLTYCPGICQVEAT